LLTVRKRFDTSGKSLAQYHHRENRTARMEQSVAGFLFEILESAGGSISTPQFRIVPVRRATCPARDVDDVVSLSYRSDCTVPRYTPMVALSLARFGCLGFAAMLLLLCLAQRSVAHADSSPSSCIGRVSAYVVELDQLLSKEKNWITP
jgi:hypothetical protein